MRIYTQHYAVEYMRLSDALHSTHTRSASQPMHRFNLAESLRMEGDMMGALHHLEIAVAESNPPLFDAVALLVFYRRLICDWSQVCTPLSFSNTHTHTPVLLLKVRARAHTHTRIHIDTHAHIHTHTHTHRRKGVHVCFLIKKW